ncbi:MAG: 4Fe-4S dicluster domain-containing protein [Tepidisphaeraceae bacterium]
MPDDDRIINRRHFFRRGLKELLAPMAEALEKKSNELGKHLAPLMKEEPAAPPPPAARALPVLLRPPGALGEQDFLSTCSRCGHCVRACPVDAIRLDPDGQIAGGAPFINPNVSPCIVCMGVECTHVCPTGALTPISIPDIDMGLAIWNQTTCLRTREGAAEPLSSCQQCVDACPVGEVAIRLEGATVKVYEDGCTGCGCCQHRCPTNPKSIVVKPREPVTP